MISLPSISFGKKRISKCPVPCLSDTSESLFAAPQSRISSGLLQLPISQRNTSTERNFPRSGKEGAGCLVRRPERFGKETFWSSRAWPFLPARALSCLPVSQGYECGRSISGRSEMISIPALQIPIWYSSLATLSAALSASGAANRRSTAHAMQSSADDLDAALDCLQSSTKQPVQSGLIPHALRQTQSLLPASVFRPLVSIRFSAADRLGSNDVLIGYARISTEEQVLDLQTDALAAAGVAKDDIFVDELSGAKGQRPGLTLALKRLRPGDTLLVWRIDRVSRDMRHLMDLVEQLVRLGADFRSLTEPIDTTTPVGKLMFHTIGAYAQFERDLLIERTKAGMAAAALRGRKGGRQHYVQGDQLVSLKRAILAGQDLGKVAAKFGIKLRTIFNYVPGGKDGLEARIAAGTEPNP